MKKDSKNKKTDNIDDIELESYNDIVQNNEELAGEEIELSAEDRIKQLRKKLRECEREKIENLTGWQRAKADFVNLKKRSAESAERQAIQARHSTIESFFPILDSFEAAMRGEAWEKADAQWKNGLESIFKQFLNSLRSEGVEEIEALGKDFDPHLHTSVSLLETDDKELDNTIAEVLQTGYAFSSGEVIRSPKVVVYHFNG